MARIARRVAVIACLSVIYVIYAISHFWSRHFGGRSFDEEYGHIEAEENRGSNGLHGSKTIVSLPPKVALAVGAVEIDSHCTGDRWSVEDIDQLAKLVAIIAMGQAVHAAKIIEDLRPAAAAINHKALKSAARQQLSIAGDTQDKRDASRWRRDGFIFEAISWIAARQSAGADALMKDPHLKSTTQGIDGLMVELDVSKSELIRATIFEDKCSEDPRRMFRDEILPAFADHHANKRGPELVATAAALIERMGLDGTAATQAAARVLDNKFRRYRAALAVVPADDSKTRREALFKNYYEDLKGIDQPQRVGASFITPGELRQWFDALTEQAIAYIETLPDEAS